MIAKFYFSRGLEKLISPGGWVDCCMTIGVEGIYEVIRRGLKFYNFYNYGNVEAEFKSRGVDDENILPYYPYRDDARSLFKVIKDYVEKVVHNHYGKLLCIYLTGIRVCVARGSYQYAI